jgi:hypothetical protein
VSGHPFLNLSARIASSARAFNGKGRYDDHDG